MHSQTIHLAVALAVLSAAGCGVDTKSNGAVRVNSISPDTYSITGGTTVQISGKGFDDGDAPVVTFGQNKAEVVSYSNLEMSVILPGGSNCGSVDIQINNGNGFAIEENGFTYTGGSNPLTVTSISPSTGDIAGGTEITITGTGFTGGVGLLLDGVPLRDIVVDADTQVRARTVEQTIGGVRTLQVRNCADEETIENAFLFTSELNGAYLELPLVDLVNPAQFQSGSQDYISPFVALVEPTADSLLNPVPSFVPGQGTCVFNGNPPAGNFAFVDAGPVTLWSGSQSIELSRQNDELYYYPATDSSAYQTAKFVFNGSYSLSAEGGPELPAFSAADVLRTPADFSVTAPNIGATTPTTVVKSNALNFSWNASTPGDLVQIIFVGYNSQGAPTNELLECYVTDDGNYQIAAADLQKLASSTQAVVSVMRRKDTEFVLPANGTKGVGVSLLYKRGVLYLD